MYHKYKLDVFVRERFPVLAKYITRFEKGCPDVFFEVGERCSKPSFEAEAKAERIKAKQIKAKRIKARKTKAKKKPLLRSLFPFLFFNK